MSAQPQHVHVHIRAALLYVNDMPRAHQEEISPRALVERHHPRLRDAFAAFGVWTLALVLGLACSDKSVASSDQARARTDPPPERGVSWVGLSVDQDTEYMDKNQMLEKIRRAKSELGKDESATRGYLDRFENEVSGWDDLSKEGELRKRALSQLTLTRYLLSSGPRDFETQLSASIGLLMLSATMHNLDMDPKPVREEAIEASKSLVQRFPQQDRARAQLGHALLICDEANAQAARSQFEICLKLNPANSVCRHYLSTESRL